MISRCCICNDPIIEKYGHNPQPVKSQGRCCSSCLVATVVPARVKQIYETEKEMAYETYYDRYNELKETYKIAHSSAELLTKEQRMTLSTAEQEKTKRLALEEYDVVVDYVRSGYAHQKYRVVKNKPGLSTRDLAIICDKGNLCFGYRTENGYICVYTD